MSDVRSLVESYLPIESVEVPEHYLIIEMPSRQVVTQPFIEQVAKHFNIAMNQLTDEHVASLDLENITTVLQLETFTLESFCRKQIHERFYQSLLPYLVLFYAETAHVILDTDECDRFVQAQIEQLKERAQEQGLTFEDYIVEAMGIMDDIDKQLQERLEEDFIYHLIAHHHYKINGGSLDELEYEQFIQRNVLENGADDIEVRQAISYPQFKEMMPEMMLTQQLLDYFEPKFKFIMKG